MIELAALKALALHAWGNVSGAVAALLHALALAAPEGYMRVFVDEGRPMAELLHRAGRALIADPAPRSRNLVSYSNKLLEAFQSERSLAFPGVPSSTAASHPATLIELLSERELEVVRLLAAGLSTAQIADELVIAVGTVRNHFKSIYRKLDAHSRLEAVERARVLKLL